MDIPELGPLISQKRNSFTRALGRLLLSILRWQVKGQVHNAPKFVMVLAPHTSIRDFFIAHASMMAVGFRSSWLVAARYARWPLGKLMRILGRHLRSFAGVGNRADVNQSLIEPFANYNLD